MHIYKGRIIIGPAFFDASNLELVTCNLFTPAGSSGQRRKESKGANLSKKQNQPSTSHYVSKENPGINPGFQYPHNSNQLTYV